MKRSRIVLVVLLLAVGILGIAIASTRSGADPAGNGARVTRENFEVSVEATGKLEAAVAFEIGPPSVRDMWEYNLSWMIPEGQSVEKDTVVARFDSTQLDDQLRDHRARLETVLQEKEKEQRSLEVSSRQLRLDLVKARGELKTVELDLSVPEGLVSLIEYQQTRLKRDLEARRVAFLEEKIEFEKQLVETKLELLDVKRDYEQGKIDYIESTKAKFNVKAPVSGLVIYIPKRNGDRWEIGEGVWMMAKIMKVADTSTLQVEASVLEVDASRISPGQTAEIGVDAIPGLNLHSEVGEVGRIVKERSLQDRSKVFDAIIPLGKVDTDQLRPGMGVQVKIRTELLEDRLTVPLGAISATPDGMFVTVVGRGGAAAARAVELGPRNLERVVVLSGLEEGEIVRVGAERT